jgi:flavin reductase (DIM6/NTAB) family NADH-FMN oxidoreductase RutF
VRAVPGGPADASWQLDLSLSGTAGLATSPRDFAAALGAVASAVTLVTIADGRDDIGVTVSAFCPVSMDPPLVLVSLIAGSHPAEVLGRLDRFAVTVLAAGQRVLAGRFAAAGRPGARHLLDDTPNHRGPFSGALIPDDALAALECAVASRVPAGDHVLVIARVRSVDILAAAGDPLIRFRSGYPALAGR